MIKKTKLEDVASIRFGLYAKPKASGTIPYLQLRQFNQAGLLVDEPEEFVDMNEKTASHILQHGDVLFVGKGSRLFASCYIDAGLPTVASSVFFVLRPDTKVVYPEYLAAILNAPQTKASFQQLGGGTNIFSIRTSVLGAFEIPLPPLDRQKRIAGLAGLHQQEIDLLQRLAIQKQNLYTAVISKLIN